jgi:hypothetical protein
MAAPVLLPGFLSMQDVLDQRVTDNMIPQLNTIFEQSVAIHNALTNQMLDIFVKRTTEFKIRFNSPINLQLQPLDEFGRARPVKMAGFYDVAFPIKKAGIAMGWTREMLAKSTVLDLNNRLAAMFEADKRWNRNQILGTLFTNTSYTFGDPYHGDLTVLPLANGDSQVYWVRSGAETGETANHFTAVTTDIADATNPYPIIEAQLSRRVENGGGMGMPFGAKVVVFINSAQEAKTRGLTDFFAKEDPDLVLNDNETVLTGALPAGIPGEIIGKVNRCWVSVWDSIPANYLLGLSLNGERPVAMREEPEASLQGYVAVGERHDQPYHERHYERIAGFGIWNRVSAVIYQVNGGDTTYDIPTGYAQPFNG